MLFLDGTDPTNAQKIAKTIQDNIGQFHVTNAEAGTAEYEASPTLSVCIGIATVKRGTDYSLMFNNANEALREAKNQKNKNAVVEYVVMGSEK